MFCFRIDRTRARVYYIVIEIFLLEFNVLLSRVYFRIDRTRARISYYNRNISINVSVSNVYFQTRAVLSLGFIISSKTCSPLFHSLYFDAVTIQRSTEANGFLPDGAVKCIWREPRTLYSRLTSISTCSKNVISFSAARHSSSASNRILLVFP